MVNLGGQVLESFELKHFFWILVFPNVLRPDKLLGLRLGLGVADFNVIGPGLAMLLVLFNVFVPVLQLSTGPLSKVIADDPVNRRLRSIGTAERELLVGQRDLHSALLKRVHTERNPVVVAFSEFVVLGCRHVSIDNCLVVQQFEISRIIRF